jgi:vancomycin aglycone glucosyltransferase
MCLPPDAEFAALVSGTGAELVPFGQSVRALVTSGGGPARAPQVAEALVDEWFDTVLPAAGDCDALVVTGLMPAGGPTVAEVVGIPYVCALLQSRVLPSLDYEPLGRPGKPFPPGADLPTMWRVDAEKADDLYAAPLNRRRTEIGLPPVTNVRDHVVTERPWLATDPVLDPSSRTPGIEPFQMGAWFRPDRRPLSDDLIAFLDDGPPAVYVGFGSMSMHASPDVAPAVLKELRERGRRVVLHRGWAGLVPEAHQEACFALDDVNHQVLFPRVAAVVHHGGAGTTTAAARAGTPQLVVPQLADQPYWGARVTALGIGATASIAAELPAALSRTLRSDTRSRATAVAGSIRVDGAAVAARTLVARVDQPRNPTTAA